MIPKLRHPTQPLLLHHRTNPTRQPPRRRAAGARIAQTRIPAREAGAVAEGELDAGLLDVADLAAVFEGGGEGLFFGGEVVPVQAGGLGCNFGVYVFAEEVAV